MSEKSKAVGGGPPLDQSEDRVESWLREAARAPLPARVPNPGEVVGGKYTIEELLGRGGMGVVFRARHVVSEKPVAIKWMLRPATDEQARKRFDREARAAGRIDHPNVVTLYDVGEEGDCSYLVMELLRGESLRHRMRNGPLAPEQVVAIVIPAMRGVAAAHRAGVVHRDLKPDNIFLCEAREGGQAEVKVVDFGVSSIASIEAADSTLTQEGTLLGSLAYMSPEQLRNPHDVDARTDVYAFGVILYELLTGELPFQGANHSALIVAITTGQPRRPSLMLTRLPDGLEEIVMRALARDREDRYPGMNSLIDALQALSLPAASPAPTVALRASAPTPAPLPTRASAPTPAPVPGVTESGIETARTVAAAPRSVESTPPPPRPRFAWLLAAGVVVVIVLWAVTRPGSDRGGGAISVEPPAVDVRSPSAAAPPARVAPALAPAPAPTEPSTPQASPAAAAPIPASATPVVKRARPSKPAATRRERPQAAPGSADDEAALFSGRK